MCNCNNNQECGCKTSTDEIVYKGPNLTCTGINNCDTLTTAIEKINEYMCSIQMVQNIITTIVNNEILYNQFVTIINNSVDCETVWNCIDSTTTTTTISPILLCENYSLTNTGETPVAIIITDCVTETEEAIVLMPGDTDICVVTNSPLTVPGTVIVTPNGYCGTTTTTTTEPTTTTTTTEAIPCECLTFYNEDIESHSFTYRDCEGVTSRPIEILSHQTIQVCGCCGQADDPFVTITVGENCVGGACPTTTTTTTLLPAPTLLNGAEAFQAGGGINQCDPAFYPYTLLSANIPNPNGFAYAINPNGTHSWTEIEYVEIVNINPSTEVSFTYNGVAVAPGMQLVPTSATSWQHPLHITRQTFDCTDKSQIWTVRVKLYGHIISNNASYIITYVESQCTNCIG